MFIQLQPKLNELTWQYLYLFDIYFLLENQTMLSAFKYIFLFVACQLEIQGQVANPPSLQSFKRSSSGGMERGWVGEW